MGVWTVVRPRSLTAITSVSVALAGVVPAAHAATIPPNPPRDKKH